MWSHLSNLINQHVLIPSGSGSNKSHREKFDIDKCKYPEQIKMLREMFPDCDPIYLEYCCSHYKDGHVDRVTDKLININHSHYPILPPSLLSNSFATHNYYLDQLSELFPSCCPKVLRETILNSKHSIVYFSIEQLLKLDLKYPKRDHYNRLDSKDYFRSELYIRGAKYRLSNQFPKIPTSTIKAILAETNFDYVDSYDKLVELSKVKSWVNTIIGLMVNHKPYHHPSMFTFELLQHVEIIESRSKVEQLEQDLLLAEQVNLDQYEREGEAINCLCCYSDLPFEQLGQCENGHLFCKDCINKYVSEWVHGQTFLGDYLNLPCIDTGGCNSIFSIKELDRVLQPQLRSAYYQKGMELELDRSNLPLVRCPFCNYCEVEGDLSLRKLRWRNYILLMSTLAFAVPFQQQLPALAIIFVPLRLFSFSLTIFGLMDLLKFNLNDYISHKYWPSSLIDRKDNILFQCRSDTCNKVSCRLCFQQSLPTHQCMEDEKEKLRLKIELAMANAVKRTCPNCNLSFTKLDGCNKMTCRCGYIMCYLCRENIQTQLYTHFCDHFRIYPNTQCTQCNKCDLYKDADDERDILKAATEARDQYLLESNDDMKLLGNELIDEPPSLTFFLFQSSHKILDLFLT